jgi:hypothetical protein
VQPQAISWRTSRALSVAALASSHPWRIASALLISAPLPARLQSATQSDTRSRHRRIPQRLGPDVHGGSGLGPSLGVVTRSTARNTRVGGEMRNACRIGVACRGRQVGQRQARNDANDTAPPAKVESMCMLTSPSWCCGSCELQRQMRPKKRWSCLLWAQAAFGAVKTHHDF